MEKKKLSVGYYRSGYGCSTIRMGTIYLINKFAYARDVVTARLDQYPLKGELEGYVRVNFVNGIFAQVSGVSKIGEHLPYEEQEIQTKVITSKLPIKKEKGPYVGRTIPNETNDCAVIATARAMNISYDIIHKLFEKKAGRKEKRGSHPYIALGLSWYNKKSKTVFGHRVRLFKNPHVTVATFSKRRKKGIFICCTNTHAYTQINGQVFNQQVNGQHVSYYIRVTPPKVKNPTL